MGAELIPIESSRIQTLDEEIDSLIQSISSSGLQLAQKLYEMESSGGYKSLGFTRFDEYVNSKREVAQRALTQPRITQLKQAGYVLTTIRERCHITNSYMPQTETQCRPLAKLNQAQIPKVWEAVVEKSKQEDKPITAAMVSAMCNEMYPQVAGKITADEKTAESMSWDEVLSWMARKNIVSTEDVCEFRSGDKERNFISTRKALAAMADSAGFYVERVKDGPGNCKWSVHNAVHVKVPSKRSEVSDKEAIDILFSRQSADGKHAIMRRLRTDETIAKKALNERDERRGKSCGTHLLSEIKSLEEWLHVLHGLYVRERKSSYVSRTLSEDDKSEAKRAFHLVQKYVSELSASLSKSGVF